MIIEKVRQNEKKLAELPPLKMHPFMLTFLNIATPWPTAKKNQLLKKISKFYDNCIAVCYTVIIKFWYFFFPYLQLAEVRYTLKGLSIGIPKITNFPFVSNGKLVYLGVPVFKHFRVLPFRCCHQFIVRDGGVNCVPIFWHSFFCEMCRQARHRILQIFCCHLVMCQNCWLHRKQAWH